MSMKLKKNKHYLQSIN